MSALPQIGARLGPYELLAAIGGGGMGRVFRARDSRLRRDVAIKVLAPECAGAPEMRVRLQREAEAIAALSHPGIVAIYDVGAADGLPFIVMELLDGMNLRESLERGALSSDKAVAVAAQVADALAAAHAAGIVHRDLKPENVFLTESGCAKILDFGLARSTTRPYETSDSALTAPHVLVGTIRYMSPEQARGETPTAAGDVFSAGLLLYELTTGRYPFDAASIVDQLHAIVHDDPITPSELNPAIPAELDALILQMLAKDHGGRPCAADVAERLRGIWCEPRAVAAHADRSSVRPPTVGRADEREALRAAWSAACAGRPSLVSVSGEPGIGKTTLVDDFLTEVTGSGPRCLVGRGRCSETLAATEAYLPILEALETLVRAGGEPIHRALRQVAPTWHLQIAPLSWNDSSADRLREEIRSASQQRVKREIRAFLQEASRQAPVLLFLDDVHWADPATVDLLAYIARGFDGMRLLIVTTHRVSELILAGHPLASLLLDLQAKGVARALPLPFLERADVERYLDLEFSGHEFPEAFATLVHTKTEGSPLFMVDMLADLRDRNVIRRAGTWRLTDDMPAIERQLPASIRSMIQRRLDHLTDDDLRLLRVASIQGQQFDSLIVADAAQLTQVDVEERLESLQRVHSLVRMIDERELPNRRLTARYEFVHVLYQNALHASLTPARRAALSAAVARSLQSHHQQQMGPVASRIAFLFESAREFRAAAAAYAIAVEHAAQLVAHREAAALARRGLAVLERLSETPERADAELALLVTLGVALQVTEGYTSAEGRRTYLRARELCHALGNRAELFPVLWGLWMYSVNTADYGAAMRLATDMVEMAVKGRPQDRVRAAWARGTTSLHLGEPAEALRIFGWGLESYREENDRRDRHLFGHDAGVTCRAFGAWARWMLGQTDEAIREAEAACDIAATISHAQSHMFALGVAANVLHDAGDARLTLARATEAVLIAEREGFPQFRLWNRTQIGWAIASLGRVDEGLGIASEALEALDQLGSAVGRPYFRSMRAEILAPTRPDEALEVLEDAMDEARATGEVQYLPELLRQKAEILAAGGDTGSAQRLLTEAIDVATAQGSLGLLERALGTQTQLVIVTHTGDSYEHR